MRILLTAIVLCCSIIIHGNAVIAAENIQYKKVWVSAYYTPLPGQKQYLYKNYAADLKVNGGDDTGADGTKVYPGMLAAPRSYPFSTKITIPGLGTGTVHDRGGFTANGTKKRAYDRLDVWLGFGDEGLQRAKKWGVRKVTVTIYPKSAEAKEDLKF